MSGEPAIELHRLTRSFADGRGIFEIDLAVRAGEVLALLGDNGAGKTTLIRTVTGRLRPDSGRVVINGRDPMVDAAARRKLGVVPQRIALYPDLTIRENLEVFGRLAGLDAHAARGRAAAALEWIELSTRAGSVVGQLSGGQQRRVNLAAGVLHDPTVLLLDEPTAGIDAEARERLHDLLGKLKSRGQAVLLSTHDFSEAKALADRVAVLANGRVRVEGGPEDLVFRFFGGHQEVDLTLAAPAGAEASTRLAEVGLWPGRDPTRWFGPIPGGLPALPRFVAALAAVGIVPVQAGVRTPDLGSVIRRTSGSEPSVS
ncbi:MAG: ABC transporter ATP-binding protein [Gemmatimonadetes bacterium]|nr:ABC transporter ATP-binding protein [Gemmatimonadota bacterium]